MSVAATHGPECQRVELDCHRHSEQIAVGIDEGDLLLAVVDAKCRAADADFKFVLTL